MDYLLKRVIALIPLIVVPDIKVMPKELADFQQKRYSSSVCTDGSEISPSDEPSSKTVVVTEQIFSNIQTQLSVLLVEFL